MSYVFIINTPRDIVGVGFFFAALMLALTYLQSKFSRYKPGSSEEFTSASRSVKPGLVCCGIVSAWTWSATLLQSSTAAYQWGVSGPWWYGVGGTIQLAFFAIVASKVKMNANGAHTFLEIVKVRFGTLAHLIFAFYGFACILLVCGSLLLGGAATVNALTGMNIIAACFLLPIGIAVYVIFGGLRATFICDWAHTIILFIVIYLFVGHAYGTSSELGSISRLYDLLIQAGEENPVPGNQQGSFLTMKSNSGLIFGAITIMTGFSGVFCDQGYWQRAIASAPETTTKAYMLGGLSWFAVPWAFASCLGLAARALLHNPKFPTYPNPLSASQVSAGLAAPAAATVIMGQGGAIAILLVVFMAVTSAASAELIAVSSLLYETVTYSLYRTYYNPKASGAEIVRVSHAFICFWAVWMGAWATIASNLHLDGDISGNLLAPAVVPVGLTVTWSKLSRMGVFCGCLAGEVAGMTAWFVGCVKIYGSINVANLALPYSALCGSTCGFVVSGAATVIVSLVKPASYDFNGTRAIAIYKDAIESSSSSPTILPADGAPSSNSNRNKEKDEEANIAVSVKSLSRQQSLEDSEKSTEPEDRQASKEVLEKTFKRATRYSIVLTLIVAILVPLPMFFSHYVFSKAFYTFWVACTIIWVGSSGIFCIILPLWESREEMMFIAKSVVGRRR
ncbi:Sodium:solute symporter family-domain-containing protein [Irpex rosettiformis]|uniref:Sodium:solute symporter family-domain-containing protein n=1 Tax=Irpex rosettiformis TaxID=378272 RepID=A0ACB8U0C7_9APHY|nr:Sodium:solute symporter family-domain-containing protein [Irpex rosettiformis]